MKQPTTGELRPNLSRALILSVLIGLTNMTVKSQAETSTIAERSWLPQHCKPADIPIVAGKTVQKAKDKKKAINGILNEIVRSQPQTLPFAVRSMILASPEHASLIQHQATVAFPPYAKAIDWAGKHALHAVALREGNGSPVRQVDSRAGKAAKSQKIGTGKGKGKGLENGIGTQHDNNGKGNGNGNGKGRGDEHGLGVLKKYNQ
jgi:hypothetical protein